MIKKLGALSDGYQENGYRALGAALCQMCMEHGLEKLNPIYFAEGLAALGPDYYDQAQEICTVGGKNGVPYDKIVAARGFYALGQDCYARGDVARGKEYYDKAADLCDEYANLPKNNQIHPGFAARVLQDLGPDYHDRAAKIYIDNSEPGLFGELSLASHFKDLSPEYKERAIEICQRLAQNPKFDIRQRAGSMLKELMLKGHEG